VDSAIQLLNNWDQAYINSNHFFVAFNFTISKLNRENLMREWEIEVGSNRLLHNTAKFESHPTIKMTIKRFKTIRSPRRKIIAKPKFGIIT